MNAWKTPEQMTNRPFVRKLSQSDAEREAQPDPQDVCPPGWLPPKAAKWMIAALLFLHAALAIDTARRWTVTHDEIWHLPIGLANLRHGQFHYEVLNPPLLRMVAALPLLATNTTVKIVPQGTGEIVDSEDFYRSLGPRAGTIYLAGRCMNVLISLAGAAILARWLWIMAGPLAAVLGTALWTTDPTMIANAAIVTTDLAAATCFVSTLFALWRASRRPTFARVATFGAVLGISQLVKFTCVLLVPLTPLLWAILYYRRQSPRLSWMGHAGCGLLAGVMCLFCWNAGYLFHGSFQPLDDYQFTSKVMQTLQATLSAVPGMKSLPTPLPRDYLAGVDQQQTVMESPHPVYLDGVLQLESFPIYYLMTILYKTSHVTHAFLGLALIVALVDRGRCSSPRLHLFLLLPCVALMTAASLSSMQLGLRYILPGVVLLFAWAAFALGSAVRQSRIASIAALAVAAATLLPLRGHPNHLGYFNEFAGGMKNGWRHLIDSNIDWGQDLYLLPEYVGSNSIDSLTLAYFGTVPPTTLGLKYDLPPRRSPKPGWHAISVSYLAGRPHVLRKQDEQMEAVGPFEFAYFQYFEPKARMGSSIYVYQLTDDDIRRIQDRQ